MKNKTKNKTKNTTEIPEEILELLPWAAIGKLSADDQMVFVEALLLYPTLKEQLPLEQQMIGLVSADNSLLDKSVIAPAEQRLKSVFNMIDSTELETKTASNSESEVKSSLFGRLKNTVDSLIPSLDIRPQYARIASVSVLAISIAVLASFVTPTQLETSEFTPASAKTQPTSNQTSLAKKATQTIILVGFKGTSEELSNNVALKGKQMKIDSPVDKDGFFQVSFEGSMNQEEVQQTIDALLAQKEAIWFAGEAF